MLLQRMHEGGGVGEGLGALYGPVDDRQELVGLEALGEEVVGTRLVALGAVVQVGEGREHDDGDVSQVRVGAEGADHLRARHARHGPVGDDEVGDQLAGFLQATGAVGRFLHLPLGREDEPQQSASILPVVDDQNDAALGLAFRSHDERSPEDDTRIRPGSTWCRRTVPCGSTEAALGPAWTTGEHRAGEERRGRPVGRWRRDARHRRRGGLRGGRLPRASKNRRRRGSSHRGLLA